jgi:hypothetical protein
MSGQIIVKKNKGNGCRFELVLDSEIKIAWS